MFEVRKNNLRVEVLSTNFIKTISQTNSAVNTTGFVNKLKIYLRDNPHLITNNAKIGVGAYLQDRCLDARERYGVVFTHEELPVNYSPESSPEGTPAEHLSSPDTSDSDNEAEAAPQIVDEPVASPNVNVPVARPSRPPDTTIDTDTYLNKLGATLLKLSNSEALRQDLTPAQLAEWMRFRNGLLRDTANFFNILNEIFRPWFFEPPRETSQPPGASQPGASQSRSSRQSRASPHHHIPGRQRRR